MTDPKPDDLSEDCDADLTDASPAVLRAMVKFWGGMCARRTAEKAAAERARDEAVADRDRLRAALEEIASRGCWAAGDIWSCEVVARAALGAQPLPPHTTASSTADPVSDAAAEPKIMRTGRANWTWRSECGGAWYISLNERAAAPYLRQIHVEAIVDLDARGLVAGIEIIDEKMPGPPLGVSAEPKRSE